MAPDYLTKWEEELKYKIDELNKALEKNKGLEEEYFTHINLISEKVNDSFQVFTPNKYEDENRNLLGELTQKINTLKAENQDIVAKLSEYEARCKDIAALKNYIQSVQEKAAVEILKKEELQNMRTKLLFCSQICHSDSQRCVLELKNIIDLLNTKIEIIE